MAQGRRKCPPRRSTAYTAPLLLAVIRARPLQYCCCWLDRRQTCRAASVRHLLRANPSAWFFGNMSRQPYGQQDEPLELIGKTAAPVRFSCRRSTCHSIVGVMTGLPARYRTERSPWSYDAEHVAYPRHHQCQLTAAGHLQSMPGAGLSSGPRHAAST